MPAQPIVTDFVARVGCPAMYYVPSHLRQKVSWIFAPMGELMQSHLKTRIDYPPVQGGKSFDMSNVIDQVVKKGND